MTEQFPLCNKIKAAYKIFKLDFSENEFGSGCCVWKDYGSVSVQST